MLIKIANAPYFEGANSNSFTLFDNVSQVLQCKTNPFEYIDNEDLKHSLDAPSEMGDICHDILDYHRISELEGLHFYGGIQGRDLQGELLGGNKVYRINSIIFIKDGKRHIVRFDTICYVCNDEGQTLEKCFAGGVLNK